MPCLSAAATGVALAELQVDSCARVEVEVERDSASLALTEMQVSDNGEFIVLLLARAAQAPHGIWSMAR